MSLSRERGKVGWSQLDEKRKGRVVVGLISAAVACAYLYASYFGLAFGTVARPGPGFFPLFLGLLFLVASIGTVLEALLSDAVSGRMEMPEREHLRMMTGFALALIFYGLALRPLGQHITSMIFMTWTIKLLSDYKWFKAILSGAITGIVLSFFFVDILNIRMPRGIWPF